MQNLTISFNAVMPLFVLIAVGALCRRIGIIPKEITSRLNNIAFRLFTPILLFKNMYASAQGGGTVDARLLIFCGAAIFVVFVAVFFLVCAAEKDNRRRGALVQGIFRSNFVLLGLPLILSLYPASQTGVVSMAAAVVVPIFNVLAVFTLETFRGGRVNWGRTLVQIARNPLIIGTLLGLIFWFTGIKLPYFIEKAVSDAGGVATPLSLIALGATFEVKSLRHNLGRVAAATLCRLVVVPGVVVPVAALMGFRGVELATIMGVFAAPTAINSFTFAEQMGSDGPLAAEIVVATSACCCLTIFLWIFALKQLGLI